MTTKLTLSLEESVIKEAKSVAKNKGKSLSNLIENYLRSLIQQKENRENEISPSIKKLVGCVKPVDDNINYKEVVAEEIFKKYQK
jgi:metal-responsive CopG/Arc/MetJ family transcriptional regulator